MERLQGLFQGVGRPRGAFALEVSKVKDHCANTHAEGGAWEGIDHVRW